MVGIREPNHRIIVLRRDHGSLHQSRATMLTTSLVNRQPVWHEDFAFFSAAPTLVNQTPSSNRKATRLY